MLSNRVNRVGLSRMHIFQCLARILSFILTTIMGICDLTMLHFILDQLSTYVIRLVQVRCGMTKDCLSILSLFFLVMSKNQFWTAFIYLNKLMVHSRQTFLRTGRRKEEGGWMGVVGGGARMAKTTEYAIYKWLIVHTIEFLFSTTTRNAEIM